MSDTESDKLTFEAPADPFDSALEKSGVPKEVAPVEAPVFKMMPGSKIPVSSKRGSVWKSRISAGKKAIQDISDAWDEAIGYYNNDQSGHREGNGPDYANNRAASKRLGQRHSATENVVYSNINAQIPQLYAKNPVVTIANDEVSPGAEETVDDRFARAVEKLVNKLFGMKSSPGINLKPKAKRAVLIALLTNRAWIETGYVMREQSSDKALTDLTEISGKLSKAKDASEIRELEGQLIALDEKIEFLSPAGPFARIRMPGQVIVDPDSSDPFLSDAKWVAIRDTLPTEYINAVFAKKDDDKNEYRSIYEPTHILDGGTEDSAEDSSIFQSEQDYKKHGFDSSEAYNKAKRTDVWYIWDKVTRRLELYHCENFKWPIWVWDDPYQLQGFFPITPLFFHDNPVSAYAKGEVSYYLDQQDQINEINSERNQALKWARRNIFYDENSGLTPDQIAKILEGPKPTATPIKLPDGKKATDIIFSITPPSTNFASLFEKKDLYQTIDRITAANEVERGGEFKTNTTNKAIDYYATMGNRRMDLRLDAIEDCIGDIGWKVAQMCLRFMDAEIVKKITGIDVAEFWRPIDPLQDFAQATMVCVGGSTQKPSKATMKREAMDVGQILSQFVKAAPSSVLGVTLKLFSNAFDDINITKEDWQKIEEEVATVIQSSQGGAPGQAQEGEPQPTTSGGGGNDPKQLALMVTQAMSQLPPEVLKGIGVALAQGASPQEILQQMINGAG